MATNGYQSPVRIIVTRRLPDAVEDELRHRWGAVLSDDDHPFGFTDLVAALQEADVVLCTLTDRLSRDVFEAAEPMRCRLLANFSVGFNHIDLAAARDAGIQVSNTPGALTEDTADLTLLLILAAARRASEGVAELLGGTWTGWRPTHLLGTRVTGKSLGIVGFGRIGRAVAQRAHHGFGMRILYHSRNRVSQQVEEEYGATWCPSLDELLQQSDVVSLHTPATPDTHHLIDQRRLSLMPQHSFLVNTSRGDVIDESALVNVLAEGKLAGAALDVFEREPSVHPGLLASRRVFLLPHLGSATVEGRVAMGRRALANIEAFLEGRDLPDRIA